MSRLRVLDLCSGIGGFSIGLERTGGFETVAFCEIEDFPRSILLANWPGVKIYNDVRQLTAETLCRDGLGIDVITAGFPCQDISLAGRMAGADGEKSGLWREIIRLVASLRPRIVILENSPVLRSKGLEVVLSELCAIGYDAEWHCIPANAVDAPHRRDRLWIISYPSSERDGIPPIQISAGWDESQHASWWNSEPAVCRVVDAISAQPHRLRALGNAVVPRIPEIIGRAMINAFTSAAGGQDHG